jgi:hypothetical protein
MGSQFVDLDDDGRIDFVTATYDGSPHVAYGVDGGFGEPQHILDRDGQRIRLEQFWDLDAKQWRNIEGTKRAHCIAAVVFDWDADGDLDLLLGDKNLGNLYLQRNEGRPGEPAFTGTNEPVLAGGSPFGLDGGMSSLRLCDWDGDGLVDLVCGSFGEPYQGERPGGVYLYRNLGKAGAPEFGVAVALIPPTATTGQQADRPNVGLHADPVDYDGDGDLDLLVGGYSIWTPAAPELGEAERARLAEVEAALAAGQAEIASTVGGIEADGEEARLAKVRAYYSSAEYRALGERLGALRGELEQLVPGRQRKAAVWVYLREGS